MSSELFLESNRKTLKYFFHLEGGMLLIYGLGLNILKHRLNRSYLSTEPLEITIKSFLDSILCMSANNLYYVSILKVGY